ncbi:unnamed protein product [Pleuronectes platessa]|uniref:Uncharacterized protein n=1 Tax=Pleuronectes platessa TaxID=8262 RepID=A0A9N7THL3_PLEPL|nr:unnamed protein product [Pleuronectes platessa]
MLCTISSAIFSLLLWVCHACEPLNILTAHYVVFYLNLQHYCATIFYKFTTSTIQTQELKEAGYSGRARAEIIFRDDDLVDIDLLYMRGDERSDQIDMIVARELNLQEDYWPVKLIDKQPFRHQIDFQNKTGSRTGCYSGEVCSIAL